MALLLPRFTDFAICRILIASMLLRVRRLSNTIRTLLQTGKNFILIEDGKIFCWNGPQLGTSPVARIKLYMGLSSRAKPMNFS
jgi:hypothetical protein